MKKGGGRMVMVRDSRGREDSDLEEEEDLEEVEMVEREGEEREEVRRDVGRKSGGGSVRSAAAAVGSSSSDLAGGKAKGSSQSGRVLVYHNVSWQTPSQQQQRSGERAVGGSSGGGGPATGSSGSNAAVTGSVSSSSVSSSSSSSSGAGLSTTGTTKATTVCKCCICNSSYRSEKNFIINCSCCKQGFHQNCYGVKQKDLRYEDNNTVVWNCDLCLVHPNAKGSIDCTLCGRNTKGAFKKTKQGDWIHSICAFALRYLGSEPASIASKVSWNPTDMVMSFIGSTPIPTKTCQLCNIAAGACLKCSHQGCNIHFHAPCALAKQLFIFESCGIVSVYCTNHIKQYNKNLPTSPGTAAATKKRDSQQQVPTVKKAKQQPEPTNFAVKRKNEDQDDISYSDISSPTKKKVKRRDNSWVPSNYTPSWVRRNQDLEVLADKKFTLVSPKYASQPIPQSQPSPSPSQPKSQASQSSSPSIVDIKRRIRKVLPSQATMQTIMRIPPSSSSYSPRTPSQSYTYIPQSKSTPRSKSVPIEVPVPKLHTQSQSSYSDEADTYHHDVDIDYSPSSSTNTSSSSSNSQENSTFTAEQLQSILKTVTEATLNIIRSPSSKISTSSEASTFVPIVDQATKRRLDSLQKKVTKLEAKLKLERKQRDLLVGLLVYKGVFRGDEFTRLRHEEGETNVADEDEVQFEEEEVSEKEQPEKPHLKTSKGKEPEEVSTDSEYEQDQEVYYC